MPRRFCKRARPRATPPLLSVRAPLPPLPPIPTAAVRPHASRPLIAPPLPPVRAPSGRAAALPSPHPVHASLPPLPSAPLPPIPTAAVCPHAARPRIAPPLPPVRAPSGRAAALPSPHPVRAPPRRCRPSAHRPAAAAHPRRYRPSAAARPLSPSVHAPPLRERAAPPGWHPRHPHAVAVIRPRRASVYRRGMAQDGAGWHGSAPAVHPRPPAWPFHPLLLCFS